MTNRVSWQASQQQSVNFLQELIKLDTSNPPGNERLAADYIGAELGREGIAPVVKESSPMRANLVARINGTERSMPALLLSSHTDVVPVEPDRWTHPPFSGIVADGCIWGRGALDMKSKTAMDMALMAAIRRSEAPPKRDLIMAAVADEENGSDEGVRFLIRKHPELVRAGFVLNEAGGFTLFMGGRRFYPIQVAEKGYVTIEMIVRAAPGHGSIPHPDSAIAKLADLIAKLVRAPMRRRMTPLVSALITELGFSLDDPPPFFGPMIANTISPNIIRGGYKDNVIPGEAGVVLDCRLMPGTSAEEFINELRMIAGPEPELRILKSAPAAEANSDTELYRLIANRVEAADPGARAVPWMLPGSTDSKYYASLGACCYGFVPIKLTPGLPFSTLYHGNDERIPLDGFMWGLRVYAEVVLDFIGLEFGRVFA